MTSKETVRFIIDWLSDEGNEDVRVNGLDEQNIERLVADLDRAKTQAKPELAGKSLIVLFIDQSTYESEQPEGKVLDRDELHRQGAFVNEDAATIWGYESWTTIHNADPDLVDAVAQAGYVPVA